MGWGDKIDKKLTQGGQVYSMAKCLFIYIKEA